MCENKIRIQYIFENKSKTNLTDLVIIWLFRTASIDELQTKIVRNNRRTNVPNQ